MGSLFISKTCMRESHICYSSIRGPVCAKE
jgi:hypothetical protein